MNKEDYFKYYIQGSDHYLIPKDIFIELFDEMENWKEEAKELKKQLENKYEKVGALTGELLYEENTKLYNENRELKKQLEEERNKVREYSYKLSNFRCEETYENQQKEFIEWLEAMCIMYENEYKDVDVANHYNCVLEKYKEIIGVSDEKEN